MCPESRGKQENNSIVIGKKPALIALQPKDEFWRGSCGAQKRSINVPPSLFFSPSLSYQQDVTFQLASFSLACFYRVIWFPWRFDLVFLLALYKGKGLTTKLTKKKWVGGLRCLVVQKQKKRKKNGQIFINSILVEIDFAACQYALQLLPRFKGLI